MNIGTVAERSGLPAKTIRYYEDIGLIRPLRDTNGYRAFRESDLHKLSFMGRARALGFSIDECRTLIELYEDENRTSAEVRLIATAHLDKIEGKITQLREMKDTLAELVASCAGDDRPDCPILKSLAQGNGRADVALE